MNRALIVFLTVGVAGLFPSGSDAQAATRARIAAFVAARLEAGQSVRLSADTITVDGQTLRLSGHAMLRFDDTSIRAQDVVVDRDLAHVEFIGSMRAFLGSAASRALGLRPGAIEYE